MTLVVTADDLGLSPGVNRGILEAHRAGVVRSTSLLVTFPASEEGAALALAERDLEVGMHFDLVGGRPVSDPAAVRSLTDADGRFYTLAELTKRLFTARVRASEVATELRAQVERARSWGVPLLPQSGFKRIKAQAYHAGLRRFIVNSFDLHPDKIAGFVRDFNKMRPRVVPIFLAQAHTRTTRRPSLMR